MPTVNIVEEKEMEGFDGGSNAQAVYFLGSQLFYVGSVWIVAKCRVDERVNVLRGQRGSAVHAVHAVQSGVEIEDGQETQVHN